MWRRSALFFEHALDRLSMIAADGTEGWLETAFRDAALQIVDGVNPVSFKALDHRVRYLEVFEEAAHRCLGVAKPNRKARRETATLPPMGTVHVHYHPCVHHRSAS